MKGEISRYSHRPDQRYSGVFWQMGRMLTDADEIELREIIAGAVAGLGDDTVSSGAPAEGGVVEVSAAGAAVALRPGIVYADGLRGEVQASTGDPLGALDLYANQVDFPNAPATTGRCRLLRRRLGAHGHRHRGPGPARCGSARRRHELPQPADGADQMVPGRRSAVLRDRCQSAKGQRAPDGRAARSGHRARPMRSVCRRARARGQSGQLPLPARGARCRRARGQSQLGRAEVVRGERRRAPSQWSGAGRLPNRQAHLRVL